MDRIRSATRRSIVVLAHGVLVATLAMGALGSSPVAAKGPPSGGTSSGSGTCYVTPNPVAVGSDWTMSATNLPASTFVNVYDVWSGGTTVWMLQTSSTGTTSLTWHSYVAGTTTITIKTATSKKTSTLASCTFQVQ